VEPQATFALRDTFFAKETRDQLDTGAEPVDYLESSRYVAVEQDDFALLPPSTCR
jgi:hypothetical protein